MRIVHKCQTCGHFDTAGWNPGDQKDGASRGGNVYEWPRPGCRQGCAGCERACDWGPSEVVPTYTWPHDVEDQLYAPGENWSSIILCGCKECRDLAAVTAGASA